MSKISNVLTMLQYLSTGRKYSIQELSNLLEVSPRMIRVYKDELEKAGIYLETIKGPYGGYVLNQNINLPARFITHNPLKLPNKEIYNKINYAIKNHQKLFIEYYSQDLKSTTQRTIVPYELILLGQDWGVAAYCELREEVRNFYLQRIKNIKIVSKK